jgi:hypothetical protein
MASTSNSAREYPLFDEHELVTIGLLSQIAGRADEELAKHARYVVQQQQTLYEKFQQTPASSIWIEPQEKESENTAEWLRNGRKNALALLGGKNDINSWREDRIDNVVGLALHDKYRIPDAVMRSDMLYQLSASPQIAKERSADATAQELLRSIMVLAASGHAKAAGGFWPYGVPSTLEALRIIDEVFDNVSYILVQDAKGPEEQDVRTQALDRVRQKAKIMAEHGFAGKRLLAAAAKFTAQPQDGMTSTAALLPSTAELLARACGSSSHADILCDPELPHAAGYIYSVLLGLNVRDDPKSEVPRLDVNSPGKLMSPWNTLVAAQKAASSGEPLHAPRERFVKVVIGRQAGQRSQEGDAAEFVESLLHFSYTKKPDAAAAAGSYDTSQSIQNALVYNTITALSSRAVEEMLADAALANVEMLQARSMTYTDRIEFDESNLTPEARDLLARRLVALRLMASFVALSQEMHRFAASRDDLPDWMALLDVVGTRKKVQESSYPLLGIPVPQGGAQEQRFLLRHNMILQEALGVDMNPRALPLLGADKSEDAQQLPASVAAEMLRKVFDGSNVHPSLLVLTGSILARISSQEAAQELQVCKARMEKLLAMPSGTQAGQAQASAEVKCRLALELALHGVLEYKATPGADVLDAELLVAQQLEREEHIHDIMNAAGDAPEPLLHTIHTRLPKDGSKFTFQVPLFSV